MTLIDGKEYLTADEAAGVLEVSPGRIWHFLSDGRLSSDTKLGRTLLLKSEVEKFAKSRPRSPGPVPKSSNVPL